MESKQINACLFASDAQLHFVRVSLYSFIEKNRWFNGTIFLLVHPDFPLASSNLKKLKVIYSELSIIEMERGSAFLNTAKRNLSTYLSQIAEYSKIYALSLNWLNLLYFSNTCLFMKDITGILVSKKISISPEKSVIYIDAKTTASNIFSNAYSQNVNMFIDNHSKLEEWNQVSNIVLNSWEIKDNKFIQSKNKIDSAKCIFYNDLILNHNINYQKIKQIWLHKNNEINQHLNSPIKLKIDTTDKKIKELNIIHKEPTKVIDNRISFSDLKLNNGKSLSTKKIVLCTICNDQFVPGAQVLIYSFLSNNKWFKGDIVIFYDDKYSSLSDSSKKDLSCLYSKIIFEKVKTKDYSKLISNYKKFNPNRLRFIPSLLTFEAFDLMKKYETVVYLDSDMVVLSDVSELFSLTQEIVVTPDAGEYDIYKKFSVFNGGFLVLNTKNTSKNYKEDLISFGLKIGKMDFADQTIMNGFLKNKVHYLTSRYNCLKRCFPDERFRLFDKNIKIIHYVGAKPWHEEKALFEKKYTKIEKLWKNFSIQLKK